MFLFAGKHVTKLALLAVTKLVLLCRQDVTLTDAEKDCVVNLEPYMNPTPYTLLEVGQVEALQMHVFFNIPNDSTYSMVVYIAILGELPIER